MKILVLNCGSSSVKYKLIELSGNEQNILAEGETVEKDREPVSILQRDLPVAPPPARAARSRASDSASQYPGCSSMNTEEYGSAVAVRITSTSKLRLASAISVSNDCWSSSVA